MKLTPIPKDAKPAMLRCPICTRLHDSRTMMMSTPCCGAWGEYAYIEEIKAAGLNPDDYRNDQNTPTP